MYERGFWGKDVPSSEEKNIEVDVLDWSDANEEDVEMDGMSEDSEDDEGDTDEVQALKVCLYCLLDRISIEYCLLRNFRFPGALAVLAEFAGHTKI